MKSMLTMGFALAIGLAATAPDLAPVEVVVSASAQSATAGIQEAIDKLG